jgi:hypothetical protein
MGMGGEIYIFDMGQPVRIADLARRMIRMSGAKKVKIAYSGLRDGEKLYEELLNDMEITKPTHHPKIKIASVREYDYEESKRNEEELYQLSFSYDAMEVVKKMKLMVPEFKSQHSRYEVLTPITFGRKNYLFCGDHEAAASMSVVCSLLATCKAHEVNPRDYLNDVIARMPYMQKATNDELLQLLPHKWKKE